MTSAGQDVFRSADRVQDELVVQAKQLKAMALKSSHRRARAQAPIAPSTAFREPVAKPSAQSAEPSKLISIRVKSAEAGLPGGAAMRKAGLYHQWVESSDGRTSSGMGNQRGVPGENGQKSPDLPFSPTRVVNHSGRFFEHSRLIHGVDSAAFKEWTRLGQATGPWTPLLNDCNVFVRDVVKNSTPHTVYFDQMQRAFPPHAVGPGRAFPLPVPPSPLQNVVRYPDGSYHPAASSY